jgi:hypothetical protein
MKPTIILVLISTVLSVIACDKENIVLDDNTNVPVDTTIIINPIKGTDTILNYSWKRVWSKRNDVIVDDQYWTKLYIDHSDSAILFYKNLLLFADDYGWLSLDLHKNKPEILYHFITNTLNVFNRVTNTQSTINLFSEYYGNKTFKIIAYNNEQLTISYTSIMGNKIEIGLTRKDGNINY